MKRSLYSLLLIFLLSCGTSPKLSHDVSVYMNDGTVIDATLLSVRDSSVVIETYSVTNDTMLIKKQHVIPFSTIDFVLTNPKRGTSIPFIAGIFGSLAGYTIGKSIANASIGPDPYTPIVYTLALAVAGAPIGCGTASYIQREMSTYYLYKKKDIEFLQLYSVYHGVEPQELQKIQ